MPDITNYKEWEARARAKHGERLDLSDIAPQFRPYFHGPRIKVLTRYGETKFGTVGVTTGWKPALLLIHNTRSLGSSTLLHADDRIIGVRQANGKYDLALSI